ncbi:MAG: hypothetical protein HY690_07280 [Chloroflexi bacterium]|nr:hypothetical protein [Chloroflexota bacterium]
MGHSDQDHALRLGEACPVASGDSVLPLASLEVDHGNLSLGRAILHCTDEPVMHGAEQGRRGDWVAQMVPKEEAQLPGRLELRDVTIEVDPVDATDRERDMVL